MKKTIRAAYQRLKERYPIVGRVIKKIRYHEFKLSSVKQNVKGHHNAIKYKDAALFSVYVEINGNGNNIDIREGCILNNVTFTIRGNNHRIQINENCRFNRGGNIWFEDSDCSLIIRENSTFEDVNFALTEPGSKINIGRDCMFAYNIDLRTGDSHSIIVEETNERINYAKDINIEDHVWIAAHSTLLKGVQIAENSVVATGSIVTGRHETKGVVIAGNPAREIKRGITWSRERVYKSVCWFVILRCPAALHDKQPNAVFMSELRPQHVARPRGLIVSHFQRDLVETEFFE